MYDQDKDYKEDEIENMVGQSERKSCQKEKKVRQSRKKGGRKQG